ncbi:oleate hydratase [Ruegeria marina]|uniref:Oleate hydratase n=1 Tax=Ruegeria marina TaxID=639004 RepID=A0A1G6VWC1_9RHOB|nr:oleate hydratase [Ruegeria marina]SDD57932.1 oleate hydratase [Ruegeria marina]
MSEDIATVQHHIVGAGIAGLSAAVFLCRDAGVRGEDIWIYEQLGIPGGSLDGGGDAETGYVVRGGRMFEKHFACTLDLLKTIPLQSDPSVSARDDILEFNRMVPGSSNCRLVRNGSPAEDRYDLTLSAQDIVDLNRLILHPEAGLGAQRIDDWFKPAFFDSNFWLMWSTMFSFQPWHSLVEMRRYLLRFMHLFPGFTRISGILRTRYNQYDSMIAPILAWLQTRGVRIVTGRQVTDVMIDGTRQGRRVSALTLNDGDAIEVSAEDCVYLTLGSMTDGSVFGSRNHAPTLDEQPAGGWQLWRKLASRHEGFGKPDVFCSDTGKTGWNSFTITMDGPDFFEFMEDFTNNRTGTGGLVTFAGSGWTLSIVLFHQPHFRGQKHGTYTFWGYGLRGDLPGDFVKKPMWEATGSEVIEELCGHLQLTDDQKAWFDTAKIVPCRMPYITSQFMPREPGDRPDVRPHGAENFAVIGQYCELPRDCVFTVEYSVRSARTAVASLTGRSDPPPPVARTDLDPRVIVRASRVLLGI